MGFEPEGGGHAEALEGRSVGLAEVLGARESRCVRQRELLAAHIRTCVADDLRSGDDAVVDELMATLQKLMR